MTVLAHHPGPVYALAMTPDGNHIVSAGGNAGRIWDRRTGLADDLLVEHDGVHAVALTPDGEQIIFGGKDGTIRSWDRGTGLLVHQWLTGHLPFVTALAVTPDGEHIISAGDDGTVRIWDRPTGQPVGDPLTGHDGAIEAIAVTPDGEEIVSAGQDGTLRWWDRHTGRLFHRVNSPDALAIRAAVVSPDGSQIISAGDDAAIRTWDRSTGRQVGEPFTGHTDTVWALALAPDGLQIVSAGGDNTVRIWDRATGQPVGKPFTGHTDAVLAALVTPDGRQIISAGVDNTIRAWDIDRSTVLLGHRGSVRAVTVTPNGDQIVSAGTDGIRVWDRATGQQVGEPLTGHTTSVMALAVTPDGAEIISGSEGGTVRIWDRTTGEQVGEPLGGIDGGGVNGVTVSPDGTQIIAGCADGTVRTWERATGEPKGPTLIDAGPINAVALTPDGSRIVAGCASGDIQVWDTGPTSTVSVSLKGHRDQVNAVAVTPDGAHVVSAGLDGTVRVWDLGTGQPVGGSFTGHTGPLLPVLAVAVASDGSQIVSAGVDSVVRVWDHATRQPVGVPLTGHTDPINAVALTPDGAQVVSAGADGTVRLWDLTSPEPVSRAARAFLAEVVSDLESGEDRLGITNDVHTVAAVVSALSTTPPLSVALLGDWGIGKSSFMRQVRDRVDELAAQSSLGRSAFAMNVRQVRFNAWHYSDDHLWVGLVEHLFRELATSPVDATGRISDLEAQLSNRRAEQTRLERDLRAVDRIDAQHGWFGAIWAPLRSVRVARAAWRAGGWRLLPALLVMIAGVAGLILGAGLWKWVAGAFPVVVGLLGVALTLGRRLDEFTEAARRRLLREKSEVDIEIDAFEEELSKLDPARRLDALLTEIGHADRYESYRGLTGRIHHDLRRLSDDLAAAREQWERTGGFGTPPLQRIVLYVDDLDRCTPRRVVDVLQAVNLLLTMELFVVVVAVDPRWLLRSLEQHHEGLFNDNAVAYLDKIFHVPIALRPMGEHAAGYLRSLLPSDEEPPQQPLPQPVPQQAPEVTKAPRTKSAPPATRPAEKTLVPKQIQTPAPVNLVPRPTVDLNPEGLRLRPAEGDFLARLTPLLTTPRAIKKLVNLYRLLRLGIPEDRLDEFIGTDQGGPYQAAALLLAAMVGAPHHAQHLLAELAGIAPGEDILEAMPDSPLGARLSELIVAIRKDIPVHGDTATYRRWACVVARYGFETYDLFTGTDPA